MKYARKPAVAVDVREDAAETPCQGRWQVYDALIDHNGGWQLDIAKRQARVICAECPIQQACWAENADEEWITKLLSTRGDAKCGTESGYKAHRRRGEVTCADCRRAQHDANKRRKAAKQAREMAA